MPRTIQYVEEEDEEETDEWQRASYEDETYKISRFAAEPKLTQTFTDTWE